MPFELNDDQRAALAAIQDPLRAPRHETILIHGVTGSGKTEVYIQAIQEVVSYGRQAIMLVPEISLTPQTEERFRARFDRVAVLHSHLSDAERHWHWERIARGEVQVVVGARSAVFAPVPHLGLIVLDEEHESSFKQDSAPRYHAREVALWRAREERIPLVLASATPSLESWYRAKQGEYRLVEMPRRVFNRPLPAVATIDLRDEFRSYRSRGAVSRQMHQAIEAALRDGGQVILLLNRRGYSTHIQCPMCGNVVRCPNCDLPLTHHRAGEMAICHYCDFQQPSPQECPECGATAIHFRGLGTQRLEAEIRARFPQAAVLRMDTDAMQSPGSHDRALSAFRDGKVQILLGTQMIAKGLDFPNVTLVGVINADTALHLPDFRAAERTFQLVTQVAGRTGRGEKGGRVLVQTFSPDHPAIRAAVKHDFAGVCPRRIADSPGPRLSPHGGNGAADRARNFTGANQSDGPNNRRSPASIAGQLLANAPCAWPGGSAVCETPRPLSIPFAVARAGRRSALRAGEKSNRGIGNDGEFAVGRGCGSLGNALENRQAAGHRERHCSGLACAAAIKWRLAAKPQAVG